MFFDTASQLWLSPVWFTDSMDLQDPEHSLTFRLDFEIRISLLFQRVPFACLCQSYFSGSHQIYQPEIKNPRGRFSANPYLGPSWGILGFGPSCRGWFINHPSIIWGLGGAGSSWDMSGLGIFLTFFAWLCLGWKKCNFDGSLVHVLLQYYVFLLPSTLPYFSEACYM